MHLLLASQALSGISGLRTKADAIFSQFPIRISLKNSVSESQSFLSQGNRAAADLTYRGEVIVNRNLGQQPETDNIRGLAAFVDQTRFSRLQRELWSRDHRRRPRVFVGSSFAALDTAQLAALSSGNGEGFRLWLGRPIAVDPSPVSLQLRPDVDQLIAIVGADQGKHRVAPSVLASALVSAAEQLPPGSEIAILDASSDGTAPLLIPAITRAMDKGVNVRVIPAAEITRYLHDEVATRLGSQPSSDLLIFGLAMQRIPGIDEVKPSDVPADGGFSFGTPSGRTPREVLADLARSGALARTYFVGWWSNLAALEQTVGLSHNGVSSYVTVGSGIEDLKRIAGPLTKRLNGSPRIGVFDRGSDQPLAPVIPFELFDGGHSGRDT